MADPRRARCRKIRYPTKTAADRILRRIWRTPRPGRTLEARTYQCPTCGGWHLTRQGTRT